MKFSEMPYQRPDLDEIKAQFAAVTQRFAAAPDYAAAKAAFLEEQTLNKHVDTLANLASIRNTIDTRDEFYDGEMNFWNAATPRIQECQNAWSAALLASPYRKQLGEEYGELMFLNAEIAQKAFSPEILDEMAQENDLSTQYGKLIASAQIPFEGGVYTLSQLSPFKNDPDDARRLAAWKAEGAWYKEHQAEFDSIYDKMVHLRDVMGKKLGYGGYTTLGYYRMGRNCYTKTDVEKFRAAVVKYLVPVADSIYREQAKRLGKQYPMNAADNALMFRSGNPKPCGDADAIVAQGKKFYEELSPETAEFFHKMLDDELMDLLSTPGKAGGGYCTSLDDYEVPFIFANFNGTQHDVEVVTHEAGHAFAAYMNRKRIPYSTVWPSMEGCEVHSMSMEFLAWPWAEGFFGEDARKFRYSHLAGALTFIPYGTMVDHFQHIVYEKPDMTPAERHETWKELAAIYQPWMRLDGEIPFYGAGEYWQRQMHIYQSPFYYIDYCLAQTVSLQIWALMQKDRVNAWDHYMAYTRQGGSRVFTELLQNANLTSPFEESCLRGVCETAKDWLDHYDLAGIE
ncbi:M3 family oligoendopeptidase [uncultured Gemmiger sp.]|uniref:M3 family oligoendopeptidase n=1 Tax=uncultured Gemmiger sp. TaxID=1623490 RepID=UPI0025DF4A17|nr:M3 family oligoendopeptidase [uncultured Gemmiger sp.]